MTASNSDQAFIQKNLRHNVVVNGIDLVTFWFANSFFSPLLILPVFVVHFTKNPLVLALIPLISTAGYLLPQLFTSRWVERTPLKKTFPVRYGLFLERLPIALLVPVTAFLALGQPALALALTLGLYTWGTFGTGLVLVGWQDMIAKIIPTDRRGRFFGISNAFGTGAGILSATIVSWLLAEFTFPAGFVWTFSIGAALNFLSWFFLSLTREPPDPAPRESVSLGDYYRNIPALLRANPNFRRYLVSQVVIAISGMANTFLVVYAIQRWGLSDSRAAALAIVLMVGQAIAYPLFGALSDRKGHKLVLEIGLALNVLALLLAALAGSPLWFSAVFFLRGFNTAGSFLSGMSITMEFSAPQDRPTFIGLANTLPGIAGGIAPLLGGWLALGAGYPWTFALAALTGIAGFVLLHWRVRDPRAEEQDASAPAPALSEEAEEVMVG